MALEAHCSGPGEGLINIHQRGQVIAEMMVGTSSIQILQESMQEQLGLEA